jgi:hypothetical protein
MSPHSGIFEDLESWTALPGSEVVATRPSLGEQVPETGLGLGQGICFQDV